MINEENRNATIPSTPTILQILFFTSQPQPHNVDDIEQNIGKSIAKDISEHEDTIEEIAIPTPVFINAVHSEKNTLRRPRNL